MLKLDNVEFYITNACNLACDNCNHFNNFAFKGHQSWKTYANDYESWSTRLDIENISIIGGEATLNPSIVDWMEGIRKLWPAAGIEITTNGTRLRYHPEIIDACVLYNIKLKISIHGKSLSDQLWDDLNYIMIKPVTVNHVFRDYHLESWKKTYHAIRGKGWPDCESPENYDSLPDHIKQECETIFGFSKAIWLEKQASRYMTDAVGLRIETNWYDKFNESAIILEEDTNNIKLHDSDPNEAVNICSIKFCHKFHRGKLYKCGVTAALPEFIRQFKMDLDRHDVEMIDGYEPANKDWTDDRLSVFLRGLADGSPIPQCKFCPSAYNSKDIMNVTVKPKIQRIGA